MAGGRLGGGLEGEALQVDLVHADAPLLEAPEQDILADERTHRVFDRHRGLQPTMYCLPVRAFSHEPRRRASLALGVKR